MRPQINYDFIKFDRAFSHLKAGQTKRATDEIKTELNKFFKDSNCYEVIFTKNTDKMFFGMTTFCTISKEDTDKILNDETPVRIERYAIEIDSRLLDIGLTNRELTAVLLHEVGHVVNDSTPIEDVRNAIDRYLADNDTNMDIVKSRETNALFTFAIRDAIRKSRSLFTRKNDEILADEFVFRCGYGSELEKAFRKIVSSTPALSAEAENKFMSLQWSLRIYKDLKMNRLGAIKTLNKIAQLSGSELEKREVKQVASSLQKMNLVDENTVISIEEANKGGLVGRLKRSGLKAIEEDLYEYKMRIKNIDDENEAIVLMRQINSRISVLDDYICYSDASEKEKARWEKVFVEYDKLRMQLSDKTIYKNNNYGLWVDYNYANTVGYNPGSDAYVR